MILKRKGKSLLRLIRRIPFFRKHRSQPESTQLSVNKIPSSTSDPKTDTFQTTDPTNSVQVTVTGLLQSLSVEQRTKISHAVIKSGLARADQRDFRHGETVHQGSAQVRVGDRIHNVSYLLTARRLMTAMEVLSTAYREVIEGVESGRFDEEMGLVAAKYVKETARDELRRFMANSSDQSQSYSLQPNNPMLPNKVEELTTTVTNISNKAELLVEGIPQSKITLEQEAKIKLMLLQYGIEGLGDTQIGVVGGVHKTTIRVGGEQYTLVWSLKVLKPLTVAEVSHLPAEFSRENNVY